MKSAVVGLAKTLRGCSACAVFSGGAPHGILRAVAVLALISLAQCEPCPSADSHAVIQFTEERCTGCLSLAPFLKEHDYVYVLFYRRKGRLNQNLLQKFEQTAEQWRWSRVFFGKVDVEVDRGLASKYIDPNMVPTNIIFQHGTGVEVSFDDLDVLKNKYHAGPQGQRWWLNKYLGSGKEIPDLQYSSPVRSASVLQNLTMTSKVAIVGFFKEAPYDDKDDDGDIDRGSPWDAFHEFAWRLAYPHEFASRLGVAIFVSAIGQPAPTADASVPSVAVYENGKIKTHVSLKGGSAAAGRSKNSRVTADSLLKWASGLLPNLKQMRQASHQRRMLPSEGNDDL